MPLSKLRKIVVAHCDTLLPVLSALALPTVHHLEATGLYACFENAFEHETGQSRTLQAVKPDLKTISFDNWLTRMDEVVKLVRKQPHLESFTIVLGNLRDTDTYIGEEERKELEVKPPWLLAGEADRCLERFVKDEHGLLAERGLCARVTGSKGDSPDWDNRVVVIEQRES